MTVSDADAWERPAAPPSIDVANEQQWDIMEKGFKALVRANDPPTLFQHARTLVRAVPEGDDPDSPVRISEHTVASLTGRLMQVANWGRTKPSTRNAIAQFVPAPVPGAVVSALLQHAAYPGIPVLERIVDVPVFTKNGGQLQQAGYHEPSRLLYVPAAGVETAANTDPAFYEYGLEQLATLFRDFPLGTDADFANLVALMLTPLVREMIDGPVPLFLVDTAKPGMGKTLLAQAALAPTCGWAPLTGIAANEEEVDKKLFAELRTGPSAVVLDNLGHELNSPSLARTLTAERVRGRVLGESRVESLPVRAVLVATGNNTRLSDELTRRTVPTFITALERPETRTFAQPDLKRHVMTNRAHYLAALTALVKHWQQAPEDYVYDGPVLPSYESWCRIIGGILQAAGLRDFLGNLGTLREMVNAEAGEHVELLQEWHRTFGWKHMTASEVLTAAMLNRSLGAALGDPTTAGAVGRRLEKVRDNPTGGLVLRRKRPDYWVERSGELAS